MTESLMQAAAEVARLAGTFALGYWRQGVAVETKSDGSPVTIADRGAEQLAREWISARFPQDGILGEEFGATRPDARRRWILDPIDGTKSFVRGVPLWGTLVAVTEGETVLAGATFCAPVDELVVAGSAQVAGGTGRAAACRAWTRSRRPRCSRPTIAWVASPRSAPAGSRSRRRPGSCGRGATATGTCCWPPGART